MVVVRAPDAPRIFSTPVYFPQGSNRKVGRRRAGKRSDEGRRSGVLSMLRVDEETAQH
jgi:hypothetical protein